MSYILDALRKSQRQRELGSIPRLTTEQLAPHRRVSGVVPWAVAGVAVATAVVLVVLYGPFGRPVLEVGKEAAPGAEVFPPASSADIPQPVSQGTAPVAARGEQGTAPVLPSATVSASPAGGSDVIQTGAVTAPEAVQHVATPIPDDVGASAATGRADARAEGIAAQNRPPAAETQSTTAPTATASAGDGVAQSAPLLSELPFDVQRSLPALALNVHVYSPAPKDRFVFLNMQKYKEGERTREGVLIEAITPEGAILRYAQQRFRLVY